MGPYPSLGNCWLLIGAMEGTAIFLQLYTHCEVHHTPAEFHTHCLPVAKFSGLQKQKMTWIWETVL